MKKSALKIIFCIMIATMLSINISHAITYTDSQIKIVSSHKETSLASRGQELNALGGGKLIVVRVEISSKPKNLLYVTSLDFTARYQTKQGGFSQPMVRPCEGLRWHGPKVSENKGWILLSKDSSSLFVTQISSGTDYLDLAFRIHSDAKDVVLSHFKKVGKISESDSPKKIETSSSPLPKFTSPLPNGPNQVKVTNPNLFSVKVGLRSMKRGKDFDVSSIGTSSIFVPNGKYDIYFVYSNNPDALYQGDSFELKDKGVEIQIVKVVGGNYGIKRVK